MIELLGVRDAAKQLKRNPSTISRYLKKHPDLNRAPGAGRPKVDLDTLRRHMAENTDAAMSNGKGSPLFDGPIDQAAPNGGGDAQGGRVKSSYADIRAAHETLKARLTKIELEKELGRLVDKTEVEAQAFDTARLLRDRIMAVATRIAGPLAGMTGEKEIAAAIRRELGAALSATADEMESALDAA